MHMILRAALLVGLAVASRSTPAVAQASGPLADSLRAFAHRMAALLRSRDAEGTLRLYGDTSTFVHVDNGRIMPWPEMSATVRRYFSTATSNPVSVVGQPGVTIADSDNAVLYVTHRVDATAARPAHAGVWTGVLHRSAAGWRIVHSHSSDGSPSH
jgi:ketosteroid isomerase-like protein